MKLNLFLALIIIFSASCYNYEGPTRPKKERKVVKRQAVVIPVKKSPSAQQYLEKMAGDIKRQLPSAEVQILEDSIKVLFPDNIQYGPSSIMPLKDIHFEISRLAKLIRTYDKTNILITGHTDKSGNEDLNKKVSKLRAQYIQQLISSYNVPNDRLNAWGLGSSSPVSGGVSTDADRRVEFVVLSTITDDEEL